MAPRFCVPGVLNVHLNGLLEVGAHAGWGELCVSSLSDWKHSVKLVERRALEAIGEDAERYLPEHQFDLSGHPQLLRWARSLPILAVSDAEAAELEEQDVDVHVIAFHRVSDGFSIESADSEGRTHSLSGLTHEFEPPDLAAPERRLATFVREDGLVLRTSAGRLRESTVLAAAQLYWLLRPEAPERRRVSPAFMQAELDNFEAALERLWKKADKHRVEVVAIVKALDAADPLATSIELPALGLATRHTLEAFELETDGESVIYRVDGEAQPSVTLDGRELWVVPADPTWKRRSPRATTVPFLLPVPWYRRPLVVALLIWLVVGILWLRKHVSP